MNKSVPSELYPQICQNCVSIDIHITGIGEADVEVSNKGMMGSPVIASRNTKADYVFMCVECNNTVEIYETEKA